MGQIQEISLPSPAQRPSFDIPASPPFILGTNRCSLPHRKVILCHIGQVSLHVDLEAQLKVMLIMYSLPELKTRGDMLCREGSVFPSIQRMGLLIILEREGWLRSSSFMTAQFSSRIPPSKV